VRSRVLAAFRLPGCPVLALHPGGFTDPLDDRVFAPSRPKAASKIRLETVADGLTASSTWVPEAESPSRAGDA
jgi:hypothetical protein